jgi:hypothetical protein
MALFALPASASPVKASTELEGNEPTRFGLARSASQIRHAFAPNMFGQPSFFQ